MLSIYVSQSSSLTKLQELPGTSVIFELLARFTRSGPDVVVDHAKGEYRFRLSLVRSRSLIAEAAYT